MKYNIFTTVDFESNFKRLSKKYSSMADDYEILIKDLIVNPKIGNDLGNNTRKIRMAISSKNKGKSGGVITCALVIDVINTEIYLLTIYDKSEKKSISKKEIQQLKILYGLN